MSAVLRTPAGHFVRHYLEMVAAMLLGMAALGVVQAVGLRLPDDTTVELVEMAVWMTVPMVVWMRHRGHAWKPCTEMAAAMVVPAVGAMVLHWTGAVDDGHALVMIEHTVMFPAMLVPMLLRIDEYTGHHQHAPAAA